MEAKEAFEEFAWTRGIAIKNYHADNGKYVDKGFLNVVVKSGQTLSFLGVDTHHQNGIAEKRICNL